MTPLTALKALVGLLAAAVIAVVATYYGGIWGNHLQANYAKRVVTSQVEQQLRTAQFAQATYEQFFDDCNAVLADNEKIAQAQERVKELGSQPDDQFGQKQTKVADAIADLAGIQAARADTVARYNANAAEYTRGQFRDANLPSRITPPYTHLDCQGTGG
jgi:hypothetical protein